MTKPASIERLEDEIADMENLARHAQFVEISAVTRNLKNLLALMRDENADRIREQTPHMIAT